MWTVREEAELKRRWQTPHRSSGSEDTDEESLGGGGVRGGRGLGWGRLGPVNGLSVLPCLTPEPRSILSGSSAPWPWKAMALRLNRICAVSVVEHSESMLAGKLSPFPPAGNTSPVRDAGNRERFINGGTVPITEDGDVDGRSFLIGAVRSMGEAEEVGEWPGMCCIFLSTLVANFHEVSSGSGMQAEEEDGEWEGGM